MPRRRERELRASLQKMIVPLYESPTLKFLAWGDAHAPLATLIFGPAYGLNATERAGRLVNGGLTAEKEAELRELWEVLRADILEAQAQYAPEKKPWGCRFDKQ